MSSIIRSALTNVPPLTRILTTSITAFSLFGLLLQYRLNVISGDSTFDPAIAVVPGYVLYYPWTFVTAAFFESNIISYVASSLIMLLCGKYFERAWGSREFFKFVAIVNIGSFVLSWASCILSYLITSDLSHLYYIQINGGIALLTGYLVAYKQLIPEHLVTVARVIKIRVKDLINIFITINIIAYILLRTTSAFLLSQNGLLTSWIFLRFYKWQDGIQGDRSEPFAFITFFPEFLHPIAKPISNTIYSILVALHLCKPASAYLAMYESENAPSSSRTPAPLPGSARAEAERRRALALKALDMRLHAKPIPSATTSPKTSAFPKPEVVIPVAPSNVLFDAAEAGVETIDPSVEKIVPEAEMEKEEEKRD